MKFQMRFTAIVVAALATSCGSKFSNDNQIDTGTEDTSTMTWIKSTPANDKLESFELVPNQGIDITAYSAITDAAKPLLNYSDLGPRPEYLRNNYFFIGDYSKAFGWNAKWYKELYDGHLIYVANCSSGLSVFYWRGQTTKCPAEAFTSDGKPMIVRGQSPILPSGHLDLPQVMIGFNGPKSTDFLYVSRTLKDFFKYNASAAVNFNWLAQNTNLRRNGKTFEEFWLESPSGQQFVDSSGVYFYSKSGDITPVIKFIDTLNSNYAVQPALMRRALVGKLVPSSHPTRIAIDFIAERREANYQGAPVNYQIVGENLTKLKWSVAQAGCTDFAFGLRDQTNNASINNILKNSVVSFTCRFIIPETRLLNSVNNAEAVSYLRLIANTLPTVVENSTGTYGIRISAGATSAMLDNKPCDVIRNLNDTLCVGKYTKGSEEIPVISIKSLNSTNKILEDFRVRVIAAPTQLKFEPYFSIPRFTYSGPSASVALNIFGARCEPVLWKHAPNGFNSTVVRNEVFKNIDSSTIMVNQEGKSFCFLSKETISSLIQGSQFNEGNGLFIYKNLPLHINNVLKPLSEASFTISQSAINYAIFDGDVGVPTQAALGVAANYMFGNSDAINMRFQTGHVSPARIATFLGTIVSTPVHGIENEVKDELDLKGLKVNLGSDNLVGKFIERRGPLFTQIVSADFTTLMGGLAGSLRTDVGKNYLAHAFVVTNGLNITKVRVRDIGRSAYQDCIAAPEADMFYGRSIAPLEISAKFVSCATKRLPADITSGYVPSMTAVEFSLKDGRKINTYAIRRQFKAHSVSDGFGEAAMTRPIMQSALLRDSNTSVVGYSPTNSFTIIPNTPTEASLKAYVDKEECIPFNINSSASQYLVSGCIAKTAGIANGVFSIKEGNATVYSAPVQHPASEGALIRLAETPYTPPRINVLAKGFHEFDQPGVIAIAQNTVFIGLKKANFDFDSESQNGRNCELKPISVPLNNNAKTIVGSSTLTLHSNCQYRTASQRSSISDFKIEFLYRPAGSPETINISEPRFYDRLTQNSFELEFNRFQDYIRPFASLDNGLSYFKFQTTSEQDSCENMCSSISPSKYSYSNSDNTEGNCRKLHSTVTRGSSTYGYRLAFDFFSSEKLSNGLGCYTYRQHSNAARSSLDLTEQDVFAWSPYNSSTFERGTRIDTPYGYKTRICPCRKLN